MTRKPRPPSQMMLPISSASHSHRKVSHARPERIEQTRDGWRVVERPEAADADLVRIAPFTIQ